jgi:hypothetical protein
VGGRDALRVLGVHKKWKVREENMKRRIPTTSPPASERIDKIVADLGGLAREDLDQVCAISSRQQSPTSSRK